MLSQDLPLGVWQTHFSYTHAQHVVITNDNIYCSTQNGLFIRQIANEENRRISKVDGLSDVGVSAIHYNPTSHQLIIGYRSGLIDLVTTDETISIRTVFESNLDVNKTIRSIASDQSNTYLATHTGVVVIDNHSFQIRENYVHIGLNGTKVGVNHIIIHRDTITIQTNEGIKRGNLATNLLDYNNWIHYPSTTKTYTSLILVENQYFTLDSTNLIRLEKGEWIDTGVDLPNGSKEIFEISEKLITVNLSAIYEFNGVSFEKEENILRSTKINDIAKVNDYYILADSTFGLINTAGEVLSPDGPLSDYISNIRILNEKVYTFHAVDPLGYDGSIKTTGYSVYEKGIWKQETIENFQNITDISFYNGIKYFSSIGDGLYIDDTKQIVDNLGSSSERDTVIVALHASDRLWVSSFGTNEPIHSLDHNGDWSAWNMNQLLDNQFLQIKSSESNNILWLRTQLGKIVAFDRETLSALLFDDSNNALGTVTDFSIDYTDHVRIATTKGVATFYNSSFLDDNREIERPVIDGRFIFDKEQTNAISVDGGNRIWVGTTRGLWLLGEDFSNVVAVFNQSNSPLPSNTILNLVYDSPTGELFIYTNKGLMSYRTSSSTPNDKHLNVSIFPNPVNANFMGLVGIKGVVSGAIIKITDVNGNLIKEIQSNGSTASWNLTDFREQRVPIGIYLFFSASKDGEESFVGKIAVSY